MQIERIPKEYAKLLFILHFLYCLVMAHDNSLPTCYIEIYGRNHSCTIIRLKEGGKSSPFILEDSSDTTEEDLKPSSYVNISKVITNLPIVSEYKVSTYSKKRKDQSEWLVNLSSAIERFPSNTSSNLHLTREKCFNSGIIYILHLPVTRSYRGNQIKANIKLPEPCKRANLSTECDILHNSNITLQPYASRQLLILTINKDTRMNLRLRLMSGDCNISCSAGTNSCLIVLQDYLCPKMDGRGSNVFAFHPIMKSPAYYCVTVKSVENECCKMYGTETVLLEEYPNERNEVLDGYTNDLYLRAVMVICVVLVGAVLLFALRVSNFSRNNHPPNSFGSSVEPFIFPTIYKHLQTEVLLIYSRQSDDFAAQMEIFAKSLERYVGKVWDPLGRDEIEFIRSPIPRVVDLMENEKLKIILVANEDGLERERGVISRIHVELKNPHRLDDIFLFVISRIFNDPALFYDYEHLHLVSFQKTLQFSHFVAGTRYVLPEQYNNLIHALVR